MKKPASFSISGRRLGAEEPCFIIAEAGVNHNGDPARAQELVRQAKAAGADCVKFQTFQAKDIVSAQAPKAAYQLKVTDPGESQLEMLEKLMLPRNAYPQLVELCADQEIVFLSTPYNLGDIDFLESLDVPAFKVASGQIVEPRFLDHMASKGRVVIASTGMADIHEVGAAVEIFKRRGAAEFVLLQCTTDYPAKIGDANIRAMVTLREWFDCLVGYSDHTMTPSACLAAVALGAKVIEKHFTLDKSLPGPDHRCSADPEEFAALVRSIREVELSLGCPEKIPTQAELDNARGMRRSLVAARDIGAGERITEDKIAVKRPGTGIKPSDWDKVVGRRARVTIPRDALLSWGQFDV